eukprot:657303-Prorocentrum_minimum.AAC.4
MVRLACSGKPFLEPDGRCLWQTHPTQERNPKRRSMAKWGEGDPRWKVEERTDGCNVNGWHWCVHQSHALQIMTYQQLNPKPHRKTTSE